MSAQALFSKLDLKARLRARFTATQRAGLKGIGWSYTAQAVGLVTKILSAMILTRLLAPEAYGLFNVAVAVLLMLEWFADLGVHASLIRHPDGMTPEFLLTGWRIGVVRGLAMMIFVMLMSWPIAVFNDKPALFAILFVISLRPLLYELRSPGFPQLRRELDYRRIFIDEVVTNLVGTGVTILVAWLTHSIWAFVIGMLAGALTGLATSYALVPYRPQWIWNPRAAREVAHLSRQIILNTMVMGIWMNLDRLVGLRLITTADMGVYSVALNVAGTLDTLVQRAADVHFSMLSRIPDPALQLKSHLKVSRYVAFYATALGVFMMVAGPYALGVLFPEKFAGAKILFAVLTARSVLRGYGSFQFQSLMAAGNINANTKSFFLAAIAHAAFLLPLVHMYGVLGMALTHVASSVVYVACQSGLMWLRAQARLTDLLGVLAWTTVGLAVVFYFEIGR